MKNIKMRDLLNEIGNVTATPFVKPNNKFKVLYTSKPNSSNQTYKPVEVKATKKGSYKEDGDYWVDFKDPNNPAIERFAMFDTESNMWIIYR